MTQTAVAVCRMPGCAKPAGVPDAPGVCFHCWRLVPESARRLVRAGRMGLADLAEVVADALARRRGYFHPRGTPACGEWN